jgi:hypothetical protein
MTTGYTTIKLSFIACAAILISACGSTSKGLILGKWEVENAPMEMTAEFKGDGTAKISMLGQTVQGTYKLDNGNELEWTMNGRTTRGKLNVTATTLELTDDANRTIRYRRK